MVQICRENRRDLELLDEAAEAAADRIDALLVEWTSSIPSSSDTHMSAQVQREEANAEDGDSIMEG
jgi:hypothetical protein